MIIWSSISCPIVICLPTILYFSQEKPLVKPMGPGLFFNIFVFVIYFPFLLFSVLWNQKYKNTFLHFILFAINLSNLLQFYPVSVPNSGSVARKGLTTPLTCRVVSICYLCAGAVYIVLCGSPTGSITLVSSLREIPTIVVLHHPFLFGKIPTLFKPTSLSKIHPDSNILAPK